MNVFKFILDFIMKLFGTSNQEISVDASELQKQITDLSKKVDTLSQVQPTNQTSSSDLSAFGDMLDTLHDKIKEVENYCANSSSVKELQKDVNELSIKISQVTSSNNIAAPIVSATPKFEFILGKDDKGFSDSSWDEIVKKGQEIQYEYWKKAEENWGKLHRMSEGWHGSAMSPVIKIICEEPEYLFKNTVRLPGRFCLSSNSRWSSVLRFYTFGDKVLKDDTGYGYKWNSPVCIYVEGKTYVKMPDGGTMIMKPFEQTIEEVIICPMTKGIPVYLCENQDRLSIRDCKILSHGGAQVGIRHGPKLAEGKYPWEGVTQSKKNDYNVWLTDPRFVDLQMEGPHNNKRPQAAMCMSGANIIIQNLNIYGWMQGPYLYGGINRVINGLTQHWGNTSDGRMFCARDEVVSYTVSYTDETKGKDAFSCIAGDFKQWYLRKGSRAPEKGGWHNFNETIL
jgi:hypothetical protein